MADTVVRPYEHADEDGFSNAMSLTYYGGDPVPDRALEFRWHRPFVALRNNDVKGAFSILDLTCTRSEAVMRCAGVAGVAVLPHERRSGIGSSMMAYWIRKAREEGFTLSSLYAFSEKYYRQFGYEVCGKRLKITCPADRIPATGSKVPIRRLAPDQWHLIDPCYRSFAHARSGLSLRTGELWQRVLAEHKPLSIYAAGEPVIAYAAVSHSAAFWTTDHISEVAWSNREGYLALMEILRGLAMNKKALSWFEPSDSPFLSTFVDTFVEVEVARPIMFRVCDVPAAVESLVVNDRFAEFSIGIRDRLVPENEGPWSISFEGGAVSVQHTNTADIEMDVRHFAQILLGDPGIRDLARTGLIKIHNPLALASAEKVFPSQPVYCPDFF